MNLNETLCRYGLEGLETNDLTRLLGVTRQRIYQLKGTANDRSFSKKNIRVLADASRLADLAAEFQAEAYCKFGPVTDAWIEREYGDELMHIYNEASGMNDPAGPSVSAFNIAAAKGEVEAIKKHLREQNRRNPLYEHDWHLRCYSTPLGVPGFPSIGDHDGKGFFSLHNIAMQRAASLIRNLGGNPLLTYQEDEGGERSRRPDSAYWAAVWSAATSADLAMIDAENGVLNTASGWKWDFEPELDDRAYALLK
jgi:hypothetical protein